MDTIQIGWISAIIIGGLAGWLAGKFMQTRFGIFMNVVLGIVGSAVATTLLRQFNVVPADSRMAYFVTGFLGASLLIFVARIVRR
ncbi:GlsB/YeaQ/YmgE family stress response membrane protein [Allorhizobium borbori]|uniref:Putative membrane protein YeaQ/YmgE (Transglycosylase-associated protein family) n=1 Tax=Allorhizobium borbori TaxID=485907 RepID=A0A7W6P0I6_9HYPH|nr:GlsB/YeaQ/YmgE family stress response membrane protein [Allorhizobium borbori]MBB4102503.1 putative membrane protein YeaQ/YmgE (transglycosylase-associated protein family) [Allorhizobium borbori]PZU22709.1 MAG: GlsB/YeaQ/YmgE family stress response membrane protein [Shinella sp.]